MSLFRDRIVATTHLQASSPFFDRLPSEIRQRIYEELWDLYDTRWHIHSFDGHLTPVFPCVVDPDDEDRRYANFQASHADDTVIWESRLRSPWNAHWKCAEAAATSTKLRGRHGRRFSPGGSIKFRPQLYVPLLVCKRMYLESIVALEDTLTFCFTDLLVARDFLAKYAPLRTIRNIDISLRVKPLITELYFPGPDGEVPPRVGGVPVTAERNPWEDLCRRLAALPGLRGLHVRLDSEDLRPWHKRVNEKGFFARLLRARAREFVLYLPDVPESPEAQGLPGAYLGEGAIEGGSLRIKRGPRPNNWQIHLSRISHTLPANWSHTLWNQVQDKIWAT